MGEDKEHDGGPVAAQDFGRLKMAEKDIDVAGRFLAEARKRVESSGASGIFASDRDMALIGIGYTLLAIAKALDGEVEVD